MVGRERTFACARAPFSQACRACMLQDLQSRPSACHRTSSPKTAPVHIVYAKRAHTGRSGGLGIQQGVSSAMSGAHSSAEPPQQSFKRNSIMSRSCSISARYMMTLLYRCEDTSPARDRMFRCADMVFCGTSSARAISPAGSPSGACFTSSRNVSRRVGCASAARARIACSCSIYPDYWKYGTSQDACLTAAGFRAGSASPDPAPVAQSDPSRFRADPVKCRTANGENLH